MSSRFKKGESGNSKGRPKGSGLSGELRKAIANDASDIIKALIEQAKNGDTSAAKILLDRILPSLKPEAQAVNITELSTGSLIDKAEAVLNATANGELAPDIAAQLMAAVATLARVVEIDELEQRLNTLEQQLKTK